MKRGKNIVLLSVFDYAGSGYRICEAVGLYTNNFMQHIVMLPVPMFVQFKATPSVYKMGVNKNKEERYTIMTDDIIRVNKILESADIIHLKSDFPITNQVFEKFIIPQNIPVIQTVCGSYFRIGDNDTSRGKGDFKPYFDTTASRTALNPDLNYPDFKAVYTPFAYDSEKYAHTWQLDKGNIIISHSPSTTSKKGTEIFMSAMEALLKMGYNFKIDLIRNVQHEECIARKSRATIFFDQNMAGSYGNSAVEAMAFGVPTVAFISNEAISRSDGIMSGCPVIDCGNDLDSMVDTFATLLDDLDKLPEISLKTKAWCDGIHGYASMAKMWNEIYQRVGGECQ